MWLSARWQRRRIAEQPVLRRTTIGTQTPDYRLDILAPQRRVADCTAELTPVQFGEASAAHRLQSAAVR